MALIDLLSSLIRPVAGQSVLGFGQTNNAVAPGQSTVPGAQGSTPVSELVAQGGGKPVLPQPVSMNAPLPPDPGKMADPLAGPTSPLGKSQDAQPSTINYNNSQQSRDVNSAVAGEGTPPGGMANPGLYGFLPQNLQHGTLRNALGALGDALLVSGGRQPQYEQRMEQQQVGQAMAGMDINDPNSVAAAVQRIAATGAPNAAELSDKVLTQAEQAAIHKQYMDYNNTYREGVLGERTQYHEQQTEDRNQNLLRQRGQAYSGLAVQAQSAAAYKAIYDRADASAKQLGDKYSAEDMGMIRPEDWYPGAMAGFGQTGNNVVQSADRRRGQDMTQQNSQGRDAAIRARPGPQENATTYLQGLIARNNGQGAPLNPDEAAYLKKSTTTARSGRGLPPGLTPGGGSGPGANDVAYLRAHPNVRAQFDAHFGTGASARVLGH